MKTVKYMDIITLFPDGFTSNCYIIYSGDSAYVIDPGVECKRICEELKKRELTPVGILLTHGHFDHIMSADGLRKETKIPLYVEKSDAEMLTDSVKNAYSYFFGGSFTVSPPEYTLKDGDILPLGDESVKVIATPGHSKGSVCFDLGDKLITGDTLFADSFGRCDLYGGDTEVLFSSLKRLRSLAGKKDRQIYPGHGERAMLARAIERIKYCID